MKHISWLAALCLLVSCASHPRIDTSVLPLSESERGSVSRTALRLIPPPSAPAIAVNSSGGFQSGGQSGAGALVGAGYGANDILNGIGGSGGGAAAAFVLLPFAMVAGAVAGAVAASLNDQPGINVRPPAETIAESALDGNTLHPDLNQAFAKMGIESVQATQSDETLTSAGFDSVIDVTLFTPVITGRRNNATFALLHKVQAKSLDERFETRTWHREYISAKKPLNEWLANDGEAIQTQMILLQAMLLRDFNKLLQPEM